MNYRDWGVNLSRVELGSSRQILLALLVVLGIAWVVVMPVYSATSLRLPPRVQFLLSNSVQQSVQKIVTAVTHRPRVKLYSEQLAQLQESLMEAESFAFGTFSYFFRGVRNGAPSGDFIDTTPLSDGRLLIRFGDVMGHGGEAATISFMLQKIMRSPAVAPLLDAVYRGARGLVNALGVLETLVRQDDKPDTFSYYTLTSTLVDPVQKTLTTLFAGSYPFYLLRDTEAGLLTVEKIHSKEASTLFVSLDAKTISAYAQAEKTEPYTVNYKSGDILVYMSDGLLERRVINEGTDEDSIHSILPRLLTEAVLRNRDRDFAENFAPYLYHEITLRSDVLMPDDCSILAIKLQ